MSEGQSDRVVYWGTGRRKASVARVRLVPGDGKLVVNGKPGTAMAPFKQQLPRMDIAAVITYQRNAFDNNLGEVVQPGELLY